VRYLIEQMLATNLKYTEIYMKYIYFMLSIYIAIQKCINVWIVTTCVYNSPKMKQFQCEKKFKFTEF